MVPLATVATVDKTGTPLANLPQSVVVVPRATVVEQGGTSVADAVRDVSGVNIGGSSTYGFFDRVTIRGMDARFYSDNFPDGDQSNGFPHSLNGVERIEVLKGPGSALFGSGPPGGTVNVVHFAPSAVPGYGLSQQVGSFGSWTTSAYATGPTTIPGLNYRVDGLLQHSDGFRNLESANYEVRPVLQWNKDNHVTTFALDYRHIERTPDPYGLVYFNGAALAGTPLNVPNTFKYSTPFSFGNQDFERGTLTDAWWFADYLTINNRLAYTHRDVSILRNSGGGTISFIGGTWQQTGRQLREQTDHDDDFTYQFEPVWKFHTGSVFHTLLTGAQIEWQSIDDNRATATLPNIANIFAPVIPETSTAGLNFMRTSTLSGMIDDLRALYVSAYAVDQIDVTEQWKVRLSARQDHWYEQLTPLAFVSSSTNPLAPGRFEAERHAARARHRANAHRSAHELERRHALQDPADRRPVRRRVEELPDELQLGGDLARTRRARIRARIRGRHKVLHPRQQDHPDRGGVRYPAHQRLHREHRDQADRSRSTRRRATASTPTCKC